MKAVWKWPLNVVDKQDIFMPAGAEMLTVQVQDGKPCLWAMVDPSLPKERRVLCTAGTGHAIQEETGLDYVGTYQLEDGALVFHVFVTA